MIARLESMKGLRPHLDAIDRLESEGDVDLPPTPCAGSTPTSSRPARRCTGRTSSRRWRHALNTIEDISDVVEAIVLKHA